MRVGCLSVQSCHAVIVSTRHSANQGKCLVLNIRIQHSNSTLPRICSAPLPPMLNPRNDVRDTEFVIDEEQGRGTDLLLIHNRIVLTLLCR